MNNFVHASLEHEYEKTVEKFKTENPLDNNPPSPKLFNIATQDFNTFEDIKTEILTIIKPLTDIDYDYIHFIKDVEKDLNKKKNYGY